MAVKVKGNEVGSGRTTEVVVTGESAGEVGARVAVLEGKVAILEGEVSTLTQQVSDLDVRLTALESVTP